jgi:hypothetical protein
MLFLRVFQHLLPDAAAWRIVVEKTLRKLFEGLAEEPAEIREFVDLVHEDLLPETTRELSMWEKQFGLVAASTEEARRIQLAAAWQAQGGQSPHYLQGIVQAAGFDLYIHEWWSSGPPYVARDPRDYTDQILLGTVQCDEPLAQCGEPTALCNRFLVNDPGYLVNLNLTRNAPPPIPEDPAYWPYFLYWGGETFPDEVEIPESRRAELEALLLKICPAQQWLVLLVDYVGGELLDVDGNELLDVDGETFLDA